MRNHFVIYRQLLKLYPKPYREKYAEQMVQTLADMLEDQSSRTGKTLIWLRAFGDLPLTIINQTALALGSDFMTQTPSYIKRNGIIAALLLVPFVAAVIADSLNMAINHQSLQHSWAWSTPIELSWLLILPTLAILLALASYTRYAVSSKSGTFAAGRFFDTKRTWPVLLAGLLGLGIVLFALFHDSAHCVLQNPVQSATHLRQTWQCTTDGFLGGR